MSNKHQRNLEVISRIDDEIIEKASTERATLLLALKKRIKKTWMIRAGAMAASFFLLTATVLLLVIMLAKEVPVYTGMTVSNAAPGITANATLPNYLTPGEPNGNAVGNKHIVGNHTGADTSIGDKPFDKPIDDAINTITPESAETLYYTNPGEDVYITVHFNNPDQFEILSFTLNGKKYQNHMFEDGSDLENIILKVNVGEAEGVISYTIDAIKYIDGTKIKDVKMEGERTIEIGVYSEKQPAATPSAESVGYNTLSFDVTLSDTLGLLATLTGDIEAVLFDGNHIVAKQKLSTTEKTTVSFTELKTGTLYQYAIIATYDALDGKGVTTHILYTKALYTKSIVLFDRIAVGTTSIQYGFLWDADFATKALTSVSLYRNGIKERTPDATATAITGLIPNTDYVLTATYQNGNATEEISISFTTDALIATVNQYLENLDGTYTVIKTDSEVVTQGTVYAPQIGSYEGFTTPTVAPVTMTDSSHTFDCYFTRIAYAVTFVGNNGTTVTEQIKYGMPIAPSATPENNGLTFGGWFTDANLTVSAGNTVPAQTLTVYAKWLTTAVPTDLSYTVQGNAITVTGLLNAGLTDIIIPAYIGGVPVTAIGANAFENQAALRTVVLPDTVTEIGARAFEKSGLHNITWSKKLLTIGDSAFAQTSFTALTIPASVSTLGKRAFADCVLLTSITFEARSTPLTIDENAFDMTGATGVNPQLEKVILEDLADWFDIVFLASGSNAPLSNPLHLGAALYVGDTPVETLTIPEGVQTVRSYLFNGCTSITSVTIPASVSNISESAFNGCTNLEAVTFATGSRATIDRYAFANCESLSSVSLPTSLVAICDGVFKNCTALSTISIPDSVTGVSPLAFDGCAAITVENGISYVDNWVLGGTPANGILSLRAGTVGIANSAFQNLSIDGTLTLPENLKYIGTSAFAGFSCNGTLTIPESVVLIDHNAFSSSSLVEEDVDTGLVYADKWLIDTSNYTGNNDILDLGANTVGIASGAGFQVYLNDATTLIIPEGIKHINTGAITVFADNNTLTLQLPASLLSIEAHSIGLDTGVYWQSIAVATGNTVYNGTGNCLVEKATGTLVLGSATSVIPTDGSVTAIGVNAFESCKGLTAIHIPASVTEIRTSAFSACTALASLTFGENSQLRVIWNSAFYGCRMLTGVVLPDGLTTLYYNAFGNCKNGAYFVVPDSITFATLPFLAYNGSIFYCGEPGELADMILPPSRIADCDMAIYYYSATMPTENIDSYWHYVDGTPTVWNANA